MFKFSKKSQERLSSCEIDIQKVFNLLMVRTKIDFGIAYGYRSPEEQFELYKKGRKKVGNKWVIVDKKKIVTYKDGYKNLSKHNYNPSKAIDIYAYFQNYRDKAWNKEAISYLAGMVMSISEELYAKGIIKNKITWGANWNNDADFIFDHNFVDYPHFQID